MDHKQLWVFVVVFFFCIALIVLVINAVPWMGLVLPAKTPAQTIEQIATHFRSALSVPAVQSKLSALALVPVGSCGTDFRGFLNEQQERTARAVKAAKMKAE